MGLPNKLSRVVIGTMGVVYFGTQCLFAYTPESNFWAERRKSRDQRSAPSLVASLPQESPGPSLAAQFPSAQSLGPSLSHTIVRSVPAGFLRDHAALFSALSPAHGSIRKVSLPPTSSPSTPVVIHIQDVHMNREAQWNIREVVRSLLQSGQVGLVALEGASQGIRVQPFVDFSNRRAVELAADTLLKENKISGPIHAALTATGKLPTILGIDDPAHYQANVQAFKDSAPLIEKTRQTIERLAARLEEEKKTAFSPALADFDRKVQAYRDQRISLGDFVQTLGEQEKNLPPQIQRFKAALAMEQSLNFAQVEAERAQLIETLTQKLAREQVSALLAESLATRAGQRRAADFYTYLKSVCLERRVPLSHFPAMDAYIRYVLLADGIDGERLVDDLAALENRTYARLATTPIEKDLILRSRRNWLTLKLVNFSLTPQEWGDYQPMASLIPTPDLAPFEAFYKEAQSRDDAMALNVERSLAQPSQIPGSATVLITGGFHAPGLTDALTKAGIAVVSYVPKIEKVETAQGSAYLSVFTQEKTPLEKLFAGEKLFLASPPFDAPNAIVLTVGTTEALDPLTPLGPKTQTMANELGIPQGLSIQSRDSSQGAEVDAGVPGEKGVVRTFLNIEAGGLSVRQERIRAFFSASTRPNKRATSLWMMALAEWLGSLKGGEAGRLKAGMHYRDLAAIYEWGLGVAALSAAILFLNGSNLAGVLAPLIGSASGGLFFLSHTLLPASWVPKTLSRDDIGFPKVLTMTLVYSAAITLSLWGVFGVEAFGLTPSGVGALALPVWSFALLTHALFDGWAHRTKRFVNRWKTSINSIPYLDVLWTGVGKIVALILLPLALVLMGIQIPFVRMGSPGPIFYWHPRAGHDGRLIKVLKIRTMTRGNNPDGPPYATPYGRVVRPIGLDEIPQIFSILTGTTRWFGARYMPNEIAEIDPEGSLFHDAYPGVFNSHYLSAERTECADGNFVPLYKSRLKSDLRDVQQRSILYRTRLFLEIARKWRLNLWLSIRRLKTGTSRGLATHPILKTLAPGTTLRIGVSEYAFGADGMSYSDINRSGNHLWVHGQPVPLEMARETVENLRVKASVLGKAVGMNEDPASIGLATSNVGMNTGYFIYRKGKLFRNAREKDAGTLHLWMGTNQAGVTSFRKLRFRNEKNAWIPSDENDAPVTDLTAAFRGPVLIQDGAPAINPDEWDDIRHLFRLPVFDHLPNFPGGSLTWGLADGKGELHGNLELRRRAFQGEAVTLALEPLSALGLDLQRIEETFREWGYQRREEAFEIKKPGDYFIDEIKNTATVRFLPGVHPHTVIGQDASKRLVVVTVLGETNQRGADLRQLAAALAKQGVRDALMVANGKDVMILQSSGNLAVKNARQKVSALLALFPPSGSRVPKDKTLSPFKTHDLFDGWSHSTKPVVHYLSTPSTPRTGVMVLFLLMPFLLLGDPTQGNLPAWLGSASGLGGFLPLLLGSMKNQVEPFSTASPAFERLTFVANLMDVGSFPQGNSVTYERSVPKLRKLLPEFSRLGAGELYLTNGLFRLSEMGQKVHTVPPEAPFFVRAGRALSVLPDIYHTKKAAPGGISLNDRHGNNFSTPDMRKLNPKIFDSRTEKGRWAELQEFVADAHRLGIRVNVDLVPWISPDGINKDNWEWAKVHLKLTEEENGRTDEEVLLRHPGNSLLKWKEGGQGVRVLVGNFYPGVDQIFPDFKNEGYRGYIKETLHKLIDAGVDSVRVDMAHRLAPLQEDPHFSFWTDIIGDAKRFAKGKGQDFHFLMEAYDEGYGDWRVPFLEKFPEESVYYENPFHNYEKIAEGDGDAFRHLRGSMEYARARPGQWTVFPTNFDEWSLKNMGGPQDAFVALLLAYERMGVPLLVDLRELMGEEGQNIPQAGGQDWKNGNFKHPFLEVVRRGFYAFWQRLRKTPRQLLFSEMDHLFSDAETVEILDTSNQNRFFAIGVKTKTGNYKIRVSDFYPGWGKEKKPWVQVPNSFLYGETVRLRLKGLKKIKKQRVKGKMPEFFVESRDPTGEFELKDGSSPGERKPLDLLTVTSKNRVWHRVVIPFGPDNVGRLELHPWSTGRATSLWGVKLAEVLFGKRFGNEKVGGIYKALAPLIGTGLALASTALAWGGLALLDGSAVVGVVAPLAGAVFGGIFLISHYLLPKSWLPQSHSREDIRFPKVLTMTVLYAASITLSLWGIFGVEAWGLNSAQIGTLSFLSWPAALVAHGVFDGGLRPNISTAAGDASLLAKSMRGEAIQDLLPAVGPLGVEQILTGGVNPAGAVFTSRVAQNIEDGAYRVAFEKNLGGEDYGTLSVAEALNRLLSLRGGFPIAQTAQQLAPGMGEKRMVLEAVVQNQRDVEIAMKLLPGFPAKGRLILVPTSEEASGTARRAIQDRGGALLVPAEVAEVQRSLLQNGQVDLGVADRVLRASFPEGLANLAIALALPEGTQPNAEYLPGDSPLREALVILLNTLRVVPLKLEDFQRHFELAKRLARQA